MNNENMDPSREIIILRSVWGKVGMKYFIQPSKDPKTGRYPECVRRVDSNGDMILSDADRNSGKYFIKEDETFTIEDGTVFNLEDEYQRNEWEAIKNSPLIAPDRFAKDSKGDSLIDGTLDMSSRRPRYGVAELYVYKPGAVATARVSRKKLIHKAINFILEEEQGLTGLLTKAKLLGKRMDNAASSDVEDFLIKTAEKDPDKIIDLYTGSDTQLRLLLIDAVDNEVIRVKDRVYTYDTTILGASDKAVISWMKQPKNQRILELIRKDTYPHLYIKEDDNKKDKK
jgi:hypothetical protein